MTHEKYVSVQMHNFSIIMFRFSLSVVLHFNLLVWIRGYRDLCCLTSILHPNALLPDRAAAPAAAAREAAPLSRPWTRSGNRGGPFLTRRLSPQSGAPATR